MPGATVSKYCRAAMANINLQCYACPVTYCLIHAYVVPLLNGIPNCTQKQRCIRRKVQYLGLCSYICYKAGEGYFGTSTMTSVDGTTGAECDLCRGVTLFWPLSSPMVRDSTLKGLQGISRLLSKSSTFQEFFKELFSCNDVVHELSQADFVLSFHRWHNSPPCFEYSEHILFDHFELPQGQSLGKVTAFAKGIPQEVVSHLWWAVLY